MNPVDKNFSVVPFSLDKIIKGMPEHAYIFSKEGKLLTWNKNLEFLTGFSEDELKNMFVSELINKDDKERVLEKFLEIISDGNDTERVIEYNIKTKSNKVIPILAMRSLVVLDSVEYVIGIAIDLRKVKDDKEKLNYQINEINKLKNQLQSHYKMIERMNQSEMVLKEKLSVNAKEFSNKLINSLPGIFYMFEKVGDDFFLKRWNDNFVTSLGYAEEDLFDLQPRIFFTPKEFVKIEKAFLDIFDTGSTRVKSHIIKRNGEIIPYFLETYIFENKESLYFMGVGLDVSIQHNLEKKHKKQEVEKLQAKEVLDANKRELVTTALHISRTNKTIEYTLKRIDEIIKKTPGKGVCIDLNHIKNDLKLQSTEQDNWEIFNLRFREVHKGFFDTLKNLHPTLTKSELRFCAYLRIHLSSSQISSVLSISNEGIKKSRYRIRKKLNLSPKDSLEDYISKF